jgi:TetR/AcrR family transcriptional repressor of nem operon
MPMAAAHQTHPSETVPPAPGRKAASHERILREAGRAIRAHGPDGVGLASIMRAAGLTHGGFYAHFRSKDDLIAAAIRGMFAESAQLFARRIGQARGLAALRQWVDSYVAPAHRDDRSRGCAVATLSGDAARLDRQSRAAFDEGIAAIAERYIRHLPRATRQFDPRAFALAMLTQMAGAVALSRAVSDRALSDAILAAARDSLHARLDRLEPHT